MNFVLKPKLNGSINWNICMATSSASGPLRKSATENYAILSERNSWLKDAQL